MNYQKWYAEQLGIVKAALKSDPENASLLKELAELTKRINGGA